MKRSLNNTERNVAKWRQKRRNYSYCKTGCLQRCKYVMESGVELKMHQPEELLDKVRQRITSLRNTSEAMKIQYVNQEISASVICQREE